MGEVPQKTPKRNTRQREAIRNAFVSNCEPMTPQQVLEEAQKEQPGIGIATVYRAIKSLCEEGWLERYEFPGNITFYEKGGKGHHHHFYCRSCQKLFELEGCSGDVVNLKPKGWKLEDHEILLYGRCKTCHTA